MNLLFLGLFASASIDGLMQDKFVPLKTVVSGCEAKDAEKLSIEKMQCFIAPFPYRTSPTYFCSKSE